MAAAPRVVIAETAIAAGFVAAAVVGARRPEWGAKLIAAGLILHGGFDLVDDALIRNPVVPAWWPVFCAVVYVVLGVWVLRQSAHAYPASEPKSPVT